MIKAEYREVKYLPKATGLHSGRTRAQFFVKELSQFSNLLGEECLGDKTGDGRVGTTLWFQGDVAKPCRKKRGRQGCCKDSLTCTPQSQYKCRIAGETGPDPRVASLRTVSAPSAWESVSRSRFTAHTPRGLSRALVFLLILPPLEAKRQIKLCFC